MQSKTGLLLLVIVGVVATSVPLNADIVTGNYELITLDLPYRYMQVAGITNQGAIALTTSGQVYIGRYDALEPWIFPEQLRNSSWLRVTGINNAGQLVGSFRANPDCTFCTQGFLYDRGEVLQVIGDRSNVTNITGVNDAGALVGTDEDGAFLLLGGDIIRITPPGVDPKFVRVTGINNAGEVVGWYYDPTDPLGSQVGFVFSNGQYQIVSHERWNPEIPQSTVLFDINNSGTLLGRTTGALTLYHEEAFLWRNGAFLDLDFSGFLGPHGRPITNVSPVDMNDLGVIVGYYEDPGIPIGNVFVAYPRRVNEPYSAVAAAFVLVVVFTKARGGLGPK